MKSLTVRNLDDDVFEQFAARAREQHRNPEAHARFVIEREARGALETCGDLLAWHEAQPAPDVKEERIEEYLQARGRRSNRP